MPFTPPTNRARLGDRYTDLVTGLTGVAVCETRWLNGCVRVGLQGPLGADGKAPDIYYADIEQVHHEGETVASAIAAKPTGGDRPNPPAPSGPQR